ncbi:MAG: long-chain fatty acid transporter, partial [Cyclobacteriaceae bacterium]|nr:long-chain fatty acid transporter [Cyclobacteriaceae bacterium]
RSPSKFSIGTAFFIKKAGFITTDIEFIDYSSAQIKSNDFSVTSDNTTINSLYKSAVNYRLGGEFRFDIFRFRAGYSYQGDPFTSSNLNNSVSRISGGMGYRVQDYYIDLAVTNTRSNTSFAPYNLEDATSPLAETKNRSTNVAVTLGFNF